MSMRSKALSGGIVAMMVTAGYGAISATAETGGHFVSETTHTLVVGTGGPGTSHRTHLSAEGTEGQSGCENVSYVGTAVSSTVESITISPSYEKCTTTNTSANLPVTVNGCTQTFTVAPGGVSGTVDVLCPAGKAIEVHHPNCTITIASANNKNLSGVTYTRVTENAKHAITLDLNVTFETTYHGGICIFLGTPHKERITGSLTIRGFDTDGSQVSITAT
jgi:hypothetical protein